MEVGGQIPWNGLFICETFKISCLMGRRPLKDVLENHLKDRLFHLVHWLSITLSLRRTSQESINLERKSYLDCSSDTFCTREESGRVTYWLQTLRSWKRWTHLKSTRKDSMRKRWYFPNKENLFFQPQMDESNSLEEIKIRCIGTKLGNTVDTIIPVWNKIFPGDPEEPTEVPGADKETKSHWHWHWQYSRIWQILWRLILESSNFNTSSIRDKWHCWKSRTTSERRYVSSISTLRIGWRMVGWFYGML